MKEDKNNSATVASNVKGLSKFPTRVADIMTKKVVTFSPSNSLREAITTISTHQFRHFLVLEDNKSVVGVVSDRDVLRAINRSEDWNTTTLANVMTAEPTTVRPDTPLSEAVEQLLKRRINCLPVVDESGRVCGIVTSTDLLRSFQHILEDLG